LGLVIHLPLEERGKGHMIGGKREKFGPGKVGQKRRRADVIVVMPNFDDGGRLNGHDEICHFIDPEMKKSYYMKNVRPRLYASGILFRRSWVKNYDKKIFTWKNLVQTALIKMEAV